MDRLAGVLASSSAPDWPHHWDGENMEVSHAVPAGGAKGHTRGTGLG